LTHLLGFEHNAGLDFLVGDRLDKKRGIVKLPIALPKCQMMIAFLQKVENVVVTVIHHWKHRGKQPQ